MDTTVLGKEKRLMDLRLHMNYKIKLVPIKVSWQAGRNSIVIEGVEGNTVSVHTTVKLSDDSYKKIKIDFPLFAECRFLNFNFGEHNYDNFLIRDPSDRYVKDTYDWKEWDSIFAETGVCPNPYFYEVENTTWINNKDFYSDLFAKGFKHFILVGYDSYLEILANGYEVSFNE
ncbi:MAG TPA: hypothetical protein VM802_00740 [Chitinophaga sp.]|uniref:hypothetical protein n=1 Tax=Chitinophaga sp. TaxID=1869181 RepID=UPI002CD46A21|nr:hypothetical protein [Chitinophaga sp.]HVI43357.1 hypothetical protein [Chitinophaga sp.]